jgi:hypothetical protein
MSGTQQQSGKRPTVTVMCKLPLGFILQLEQLQDDPDPPRGGDKKAQIWHRTGEQITITGANYAHKGQRGVAGWGLTEVDAEVWEKWKVQKEKWPPLQKGWVFASQSGDKAEGQAKEQRSMKTGLEPLDPDKPAPGIEKVPA